MARYSRRAALRKNQLVVDRRPGAANDDGAPEALAVAFAVHVHENGESAVLHTQGWGVGRHQGNVRFDLGDETFNQVKYLDWDGAACDVDLEFVPSAAIAVIDDGDEIRF